MLFYSWYPAVMLAFEAGSVIDMRLRKIARGGEQGASESRLMVMEKVDALFEAGSRRPRETVLSLGRRRGLYFAPIPKRPPPSQRVSPCMVKLSSGRPSTFISR